MQQVHCALRVNEPPDGFTYTPFLLAVKKKYTFRLKLKLKVSIGSNFSKLSETNKYDG